MEMTDTRDEAVVAARTSPYRVGGPGTETAPTDADYGVTTATGTRARIEQLRQRARSLPSQASASIHNHPLMYLGVVIATGFLLGRLLQRQGSAHASAAASKEI